MAKTGIIKANGKMACPHCGAEYGDAIGDKQVAVGGISFVGDQGHKVICNKCRQSFWSRSPRDSAPANENQLPPRGIVQPL